MNMKKKHKLKFFTKNIPIYMYNHTIKIFCIKIIYKHFQQLSDFIFMCNDMGHLVSSLYTAKLSLMAVAVMKTGRSDQ